MKYQPWNIRDNKKAVGVIVFYKKAPSLSPFEIVACFQRHLKDDCQNKKKEVQIFFFQVL